MKLIPTALIGLSLLTQTKDSNKDPMNENYVTIKVGDTTLSGFEKNGLRNGNWIQYYPDQTVKAIHPYLNGSLHGKVREFYLDQKIRSSLEYCNGKLYGNWYFWSKDQKLKANGSIKPNIQKHSK